MLPPLFPALAASLLTLSLLTTIHAAPTLVYGLMDQEPPVGRVNSPFSFNLFPGSFNSTSDITYTTSALPAWLSWNSASLAFTGTPSSSDIGNELITLTATDSTGSISSDFTLIVTNYTVPGVHSSFTTQIANPPLRVFASASTLPGDTGVSVPPYWSFSLGFAGDTFRLSNTEPTNGDLFVMAHERGAVGLPGWLNFDNETMTFNGSAPGSGSFTIVVTGTDFWGYTGAQTSFVIAVGQGEPIEQARGRNFTAVETIARGKVDYEIPLEDILVNGTAATAGQVAFEVDQTDFPWLDVSGNTLSGTVPDSYINGTTASLFVPVTISSTNASNTLDLLTWIPLDVTPYFFTAFSLPSQNTSASSTLAFDLSSFITNSSATVNATVNPTEAAQWFVYHQNNATLVGTVPKSPEYDNVTVIFTAAEGGQTATADLAIHVAGASGNPGTNGTAPVPNGDSSGGGLSKGAKIGLGVGLAILGLILLALLLFFFCCRRRKNREEGGKARDDDDNDSFVATSPRSPPAHGNDPFRRSAGLEPPRNLLGEIARFSGFSLRQTDDKEKRESQDQPTRMGGLRGIFTLADEKQDNHPAIVTPRLTQSSSDFLADGQVVGIADPGYGRPSQDRASSFTQSFDSESSRASWESRESFHWSSGENETLGGTPNRNRISTTPSIPRPRSDFTPRYPRNNSPTRLAQLASQHTLGMAPEEYSSGSGHEDSMEGSFGYTDGSLANSDFPSGPTGLGRFGDSGFKSIDEEDEDTSGEGPAIVSMAERQSFETRRPVTERPGPKLRPSKERIASPTESPQAHEYSAQGLMDMGQEEEGMYDDAEEYRRSMVGREGVGLGYPASSIFGSEYPDGESEQNRSSTITAIPPHDNPMSPPLPQVGSFVRHSNTPSGAAVAAMARPASGSANDGRVIACANETFSIHPQIHPPPTVSLSAATWSSAPPSTYRAEVEGGGSLPSWLHFDARELELWGVPSLNNGGEVTVIRIIEKLPRDKRRSDPMAFGYEPQQEREVGRIVIEVVDRVRSPQFAFENSPHAF